MTVPHPRLSISALCSWTWTFEQDLEMWSELGVHHVGLTAMKLDAFGHDAAVAALRERNIKASCVVAGGFDLRQPDTWDQARQGFLQCMDTALALEAPCIYTTTGRTTGALWYEVLDTFARAVEPTIAAGHECGVTVALEPSLRTDVSFVHSLRDALVVAKRTGIAVVADIGNCWMERDVEGALSEAGSNVALVQLSDVKIGTLSNPAPGGRSVPGDGELPIERWLRAALATGYQGQIELEMVGPDIEAQGYRAALERAIEHVNPLLTNVLD